MPFQLASNMYVYKSIIRTKVFLLNIFTLLTHSVGLYRYPKRLKYNKITEVIGGSSIHLISHHLILHKPPIKFFQTKPSFEVNCIKSLKELY